VKRRDLRDVNPQGKDVKDAFFILYIFCSWVSSFKGGMSLTLVTFFFETSKPQANIYYALVGLECQA